MVCDPITKIIKRIIVPTHDREVLNGTHVERDEMIITYPVHFGSDPQTVANVTGTYLS